MDYTGLLKAAKSMYSGFAAGPIAAGALRGAAIGGVGGAATSLLSGGNIISGGLGGAFVGAGLGAGGNWGAGKIGRRHIGSSNNPGGALHVMGMLGKSANKPFMHKNFGFGSGSEVFKKGHGIWGATIRPGRNARVSVGGMRGSNGMYASARLSTLAGIAGGLIGHSRGSKNHSQIMSNSMSAGMGNSYF